jgi:hypothetical protein
VLSQLIEEIISILRYIASPAVGLTVVLLADDRHEIVQTVARAVWPSSDPRALWVLGGFLVIVGMTVYFAHQTLFHFPLAIPLFVWWHTRGRADRLTVDSLKFARWERRGANANTTQYSAQSVMDETSAAGQFFYCSAWSSLLFEIMIWARFSKEYQQAPTSWAVYWTIFACLFMTGLIADYRTTKWDIEAYDRYK